MSRYEPVNRFHEYILRAVHRRGMVMEQISSAIRTTRAYTWLISNQPSLTQRKRRERLETIARLLMEPASKLLFLAGGNPWAMRLELDEQTALWEMCERLVQAKERGEPKPPVVVWHELCTVLFGGVHVVQQMTPGELADWLRPEAEGEGE